LFQAEDGIRDATVTGVQTCALPIYGYPPAVQLAVDFARVFGLEVLLADKSILVDFKVRTFARILDRLNLLPEEQRIVRVLGLERSEERRVGRESRCGGWRVE